MDAEMAPEWYRKRVKTPALFLEQAKCWDRWYARWTTELHSSASRDSRYRMEEVIIWYMAPRVDRNVSLTVQHLLKSPFAVHKTTGQVCVPLPTDSEPGTFAFDPRAPELHVDAVLDSAELMRALRKSADAFVQRAETAH
jgi:DNA primase catalytic subunit